MLYFTPGTKRGNGVGVFNAWEKSKEHEEIHELVRYLVFWVAGTKLIFIALLIVIIITGERVTQLAAVGALILSILSFFWKLFPIIKRMDANGQIDPKGYAKTLGLMIGTFVAAFTAVFIIALV
ncbi:MAG: hypothetical protein HQ557_10785 [Bacteroidetes bacterium]|nr:hypothetical protein [Bacteroidota bacterium]